MCGISGIIVNNINNKYKSEIESMTDIIKHRGPDSFGYYTHEKFLFGHRRLSIIDLSPKGKQPMEHMDKYVITYNGEVYNYLELKNELIQNGYTFVSETDTEVIMAAYDFWGEECLDKFNGMWAFALYDKSKNIIFCSRDRFGVKPFYYAEINKKFVFGSEIKQFTILPGWEAVANKTRLQEYFWSGVSDHTNETMFENVYQLRGGEKLIYDLNNYKYSLIRWYDLTQKVKNKSEINFINAKDEFKELFTNAVKLRLRSDVKIGSCLSGGLDSSSIVCVANRILKEDYGNFQQETVSSCFNEKKYDEQDYIDEVVKELKINSYKVFPDNNNLFNNLDKITWYQDEPFISTSIFAQWEVFKCAKENGIKVMLDGQGADEQLAGYKRFYTSYLAELFLKLNFPKLFSNIENHRVLYGNSKISQIKGLMILFIAFFTPDIFQGFIRKMKKKFLNQVTSISHIFIEDSIGKSKSKEITSVKLSVRDESLKDILYHSLPKLLHYEDRNSMAHSIESRVPFVDYRVIEFILGLPSEFKIQNSIRKYILREAMKGIVPNRILKRFDKMAFATPEEVWIRNNPNDFRKEIELSCEYLNGLIDKQKTLEWFDQTINSSKSFNHTFWKLVSVGRWIKVFGVKIK